MAQRKFFVLRIRCEPLYQRSLFAAQVEPQEVITSAIMATPEAVVRGATVWHIGAPTWIEGGAMAFQIGKIQSVNTPQFDSESQAFFETDAEQAPFTWGLFDTTTQSCAVLKKAGVASDPREIAMRLEKLLNASNLVEDSGYQVVVDELFDPDEFLTQLHDAYRVTKFSFRAAFENPYDVENLIHRPAERFNEVVGGETTKVEVEGEDLNKDVLDELTRSVMSVGDGVTATIQDAAGNPKRRIFSRGTPLQDAFDPEVQGQKPFPKLLVALRAAYARLRYIQS